MAKAYLSIPALIILITGSGAAMPQKGKDVRNLSFHQEHGLVAKKGFVSCRIECKPLISPSTHDDWWGTDVPYNRADVYISGIDLRVHTKIISLPVSAYAGIANPDRLSIDTKSNGFVLHISGGDAGVAYNAILRFKNTKLGYLITERQVIHGEMTESNERTLYHYPLDLD